MRDEELPSPESGVEFDPRYSEIEFLLGQFDSQADPLNYVGDVARINWGLIFEYSEQLLAKCFDLRVALWWMRAKFHLEGISAFYVCVALIDNHYERGDITVFPQADAGQPADSFHAAALGWLATSQCLHDLRNSRIVADNQLTINELLNMRVVQGQDERDLHFSEAVKIVSMADTQFSDQRLPTLQEQLALGMQALVRIEHYANAQSKDYRLDCHSLRDYLCGLSQFLSELGQRTVVSELESNPSQEELGAGTLGHSPIRSRQEVILLLDQVLEYFQQYEPSHPAPILLRRSQKMIGMDFAAIVEELLPESLMLLTQLSGK